MDKTGTVDRKKIFLIALLITAVLIPVNCLGAFKYINSSTLRIIEGILAGTLLYLLFLPYLKQGCIKKTSTVDISVVLLFALFSSYRFIYFYTNNITRIPFIWVLAFVLVFFTLFIVLFYFFRAAVKNENDAVIFTLLIIVAMCLNFSYIDLIPAYVGFTVFLGIAVTTFLNTQKIISFLKPFCITMLILCALNGIVSVFNTKVFKVSKPASVKTDIGISKVPKRDIYIILLDMYAGDRTLKYLGYDNSDFYNALKNRGFTVYENIESNYSRTIISLSSFLNADYVENLPYDIADDAVSGAKMFQMAKLAGYRVYYLNSWPIDFHVSEGVIDEAYNTSCSIASSIMQLFVDKTLLYNIVNLKITNEIKKLDEAFKFANYVIEKKDTKKFAFLHFLMPHPPYLRNENGELNPAVMFYDKNIQDGTEISKEAYLGYLKYTNETVFAFLDKIFAKKGEKPIVIIMGDHGARITQMYDDVKYRKEIENNFKYHFNTFFAYYNPDMEKKYYSNTKSLINFSINFMNENFGMEFNNVKDKSFYITSPHSIFSRLETLSVEY